jgi:hypothetical protein
VFIAEDALARADAQRIRNASVRFRMLRTIALGQILLTLLSPSHAE